MVTVGGVVDKGGEVRYTRVVWDGEWKDQQPQRGDAAGKCSTENKESQNTEDKDKKEGKKEGFIWP